MRPKLSLSNAFPIQFDIGKKNTQVIQPQNKRLLPVFTIRNSIAVTTVVGHDLRW